MQIKGWVGVIIFVCLPWATILEAQPITHKYIGAAYLASEYSRGGTTFLNEFVIVSSADETFSANGFDAFSVSPTDDSDSGWQLTYGYRFQKHFAVEAQFFDAGRFSQDGENVFENLIVNTPAGSGLASESGTAATTVSHRGVSVIGVALYPLNRFFSLKGKVGFGLVSIESQLRTSAQGNVTGIDGEVIQENSSIQGVINRNETDVPVIIGAQLDFRWSRDWGIAVFGQRMFDVSGGIIGESGDLDVLGAQLNYYF